MMERLALLEEKIGYQFQEQTYLRRALTHSSYANEMQRGKGSNERQEFLGDSVLSLIVSDYLFHTFHVQEGDLTKMRAAIVCEESLCKFAKSIDLGTYLYFGKGEENNGGRTRPSILADAFEAVLAAIYLDGGFSAARTFMMPFVEQSMPDVKSGKASTDYKTILQEIVQKSKEEQLTYVLIGEEGPDHDKKFFYEVHLNSNVIGKGSGRSKKTAEQAAAKEALQLLGCDT